MHELTWLPPHAPDAPFPDVGRALHEPNGLLAVGGDLAPARLLRAYRAGIFPWYSPGEPILWWSPDPRAVIVPERLRVPRRLARTLRQGRFRISYDTAFRAVVEACAAPRHGSSGTWISAEMMDAYTRLHRLGHAHSVEAWDGETLVGGLYGVAVGQVFSGESMFSRARDASKVVLAHLCARLRRLGFTLLDGQVLSGHLLRLGAETLSRQRFVALLRLPGPGDRAGAWPAAARADETPA
ncbi:MAG TPA: leucyl/phenylalanyl-tRNA--protein transferase [Gammaproteobacteria bacterium]